MHACGARQAGMARNQASAIPFAITYAHPFQYVELSPAPPDIPRLFEALMTRVAPNMSLLGATSVIKATNVVADSARS